MYTITSLDIAFQKKKTIRVTTSNTLHLYSKHQDSITLLILMNIFACDVILSILNGHHSPLIVGFEHVIHLLLPSARINGSGSHTDATEQNHLQQVGDKQELLFISQPLIF